MDWKNRRTEDWRVKGESRKRTGSRKFMGAIQRGESSCYQRPEFFNRNRRNFMPRRKTGAGKSTVVWALMEMLEEYHANARGRITLGEKSASI